MQEAVGGRPRAPLVRLAVFAVLALWTGCVGPQHSYGPLPVRNQHPAQLTAMHLDPAPATPLRGGAIAARASAAYTSLFLAGVGAGNALTMDGELLRTALQLRLGLGHDVELTAELPWLHTSGGVLDSFLIDYHALFGFPSQGRDTSPKNRFDVGADYQGQRVYGMTTEALMLADVPLSLCYGILPARLGSPGLALRAGIELPTGDADRGAGNGTADYAIGLAATWPLAFGTLHADVQHAFVGSPLRARAAGFEFADVTSAACALELPLLDDLSALVQTEWETSTLRRLAFDRADKEQMLLWLGGRLRLDRDLFVELSFGEDLIGFVSPDFTAWLGFAWLPGAARGKGGD